MELDTWPPKKYFKLAVDNIVFCVIDHDPVCLTPATREHTSSDLGRVMTSLSGPITSQDTRRSDQSELRIATPSQSAECKSHCPSERQWKLMIFT